MRYQRKSRREFMGIAGAGIAGILGGTWPEAAVAAEGPDVDLVVFNAKVYTVDSRALEAMISGGIMTGFGDEWIRLGATSEHAVDGSFSERTMALSSPYPGVEPPYKGNLTETNGCIGWVSRSTATPTESSPSTWC
jgi:hypothetical protein